MIRRLLGLVAALALASLLIQRSGVAAAPIFTGNAETDFNPLTQAGVQVIADANGIDVGLPSQFPLGSISGWDLKDVRVFYDAGLDTLHVAVNAYSILGDPDGDGDPGNTSGLLALSGGIDRPDLAGTESVAVALDLDEDGIPDVIAGVPALQDFSGFRVSSFAGSLANPAFAFGPVLPGHLGPVFGSPSAAAPDLEFSILNFSALPKSSGTDRSVTSFGVNVFAGSVEDDGVGEDFTPGGGMFGGAEDPTPTPVPSPTCPPPPTPEPGEERCYTSPSIPGVVFAFQKWTVDPVARTVRIRTTFSRSFVDNTYGANAVGWGSKGHTFDNLVGSDHVQLALFDAAGVKKLEFKQDYISASSGAPSGYDSLGVTGGEGRMLLGSAASIRGASTSIDENLNALGYRLTSNSPATDAAYTPNAQYPNWLYEVWYEVTVGLDAFGPAGFGKPLITSVHASPSKTGNNTEPVEPDQCIKVYTPTPVPACPGGPTATATAVPTRDPGGEQCYIGKKEPVKVKAQQTWTDNGDGSLTIRTTFARTFVDNSYGANAVGWPKDHKFKDLVGSDHLQLTLHDAAGARKLEFKLDYVSEDKQAPSGFRSLGVTGGEGKMVFGPASAVLGATSSIDQNLNGYGYLLTTDSPATDAAYTPNPQYPNWIYDVWYEVRVQKSAFGAAGFGYPRIAEVHASPSKTGENSEPVVTGPCPPPATATPIPGPTATPGPGGSQCYVGLCDPQRVNARQSWTDNGDGSLTIRTTFSKGFVDNSYGSNAVGWPNGHKFGDLVGSDHLQLALHDATGAKKLELKLDYISASSAQPSGYDSLGVTGGEGKMILGSASAVLGATSSLDQNLNTLGHVLTSNSPATDAAYTPNPQYPNWIFDVWYEVRVQKSAFGAAGFGYPRISSVHASPSKTGNNTEDVAPGPCQ